MNYGPGEHIKNTTCMFIIWSARFCMMAFYNRLSHYFIDKLIDISIVILFPQASVIALVKPLLLRVQHAKTSVGPQGTVGPGWNYPEVRFGAICRPCWLFCEMTSHVDSNGWTTQSEFDRFEQKQYDSYTKSVADVFSATQIFCCNFRQDNTTLPG